MTNSNQNFTDWLPKGVNERFNKIEFLRREIESINNQLEYLNEKYIISKVQNLIIDFNDGYKINLVNHIPASYIDNYIKSWKVFAKQKMLLHQNEMLILLDGLFPIQERSGV